MGKGRTVSKIGDSALDDACLQIYAAYPRHLAKAEAIKAIKNALVYLNKRNQDKPAEWLLERVKMFASSPAGQRGVYTPYPASWFNKGRYDDDPEEWGLAVKPETREPSGPSLSFADREVQAQLKALFG